MANPHFGKISEVWKHGVLAEVLSADRPRRFAETHSGSAEYELTHTPERDYGIFGFIQRSAGDDVLRRSSYRRVLDSLPMIDGRPSICPGSPFVAMKSLGAHADHVYFDTDPDSVETVADAARALGIGPHVRADLHDGCSGVLDAHLDHPDGCVHIDPFDPLEPGIPGGPSPVDVARRLSNAGTRVLYLVRL